MSGAERGVPAELRERRQWVGFVITQQEGGKWGKRPVNPLTGGAAMVNEASTWGTFEQARRWLAQQPSHPEQRYRLGFAFTADDPYVGIDLDHCYDEQANLLPWAERIAQRLNSYTELSVSRTGLHIIARGKLPEGGRRKGQIEMYEASRFFVVTGDYLFSYPLEVEERTAELAALHAEVFGAAETRKSGDLRYNPVAQVSRLASQNDVELLNKARAARNGAKFEQLWQGRWEGLYPSQSEADLALCGLLAFWAGNDPGRIDGLFRQSGLMRAKWDERHFGDGRTYGEDRIRMAVANGREVYGENRVSGFKEPEWAAGEGDCANFFPAPVDLEEPEWLRDHPAEREAGLVVSGAEAAARAPGAEAPATNEAGFPALPEGALVDPALGAGACPWLDAYAAYSRSWAPVAFDDFHEGVGLFLLSAVGGRRVVTHLNGPHYGNLSIAFVARSSLFRKTTTVKIGREVLEAAGLGFFLAPSDSTPEAFIKKLAEKGPGDWSGLSGAKLAEAEVRAAFAAQKGWIHNEFGGKLDKIAQDTGPMAGFSPLLRELDDCPPRYEYSTTGRGDAVIEQPCVALMVSMTPADLMKHARRSSPLWGNGFWARIGIISPPADLRPPTPESREEERVPPPGLAQGLRGWHDRLGIPEVWREERGGDKGKWWEVTINRPPARAYPLGAGVKAAHDRYAGALEQAAFDLHLDALDGGYTRLAEKALRIALLLASVSGAERIELRHWARAQGFTERLRQGLHRLYGEVNGNAASQAEQARVEAEERILRELKKRGQAGASLNQLRQGTALSLETCGDTLKRLIEAGVVKVIRTNRESKPVYALVPGENES